MKPKTGESSANPIAETGTVAAPVRFRLLCLVGLIAFVALGHVLYIRYAGAMVFNLDFVFGENGNQMFRVDQMARGKLLYRDIESQYGPLPIYIWFLFAGVFGNLTQSNVAFHGVLTLALVAVMFHGATRAGATRAGCLAAAATLGILCFAQTPYLQQIAVLSSNFEYIVIERLLLVCLAFSWQPPSQRRRRDWVVAVAVLGIWQLTKVGGGVMALAAYFFVDVVWLAGTRSTAQLQPWLRWWVTVSCWCAGIEVVRCAAFVGLAGWDLGLRSAWPVHIAREYVRTWLTIWAGPGHFAVVVVPILMLLMLAGGCVLRVARRDKSESLLSDIQFSRGLVASLFFVLGAVPKVGYFGSEWHFFQYQWALIPLGLVAVAHYPAALLPVMLAAHIGPLRLTAKNFAAAAIADTDQLKTAIGLIDANKADPRHAVMIHSDLWLQNHPGTRSLIIQGWGATGWYVMHPDAPRPRNPYFSTPYCRTAADNQELAALLPNVDLVIVQWNQPPDSDRLIAEARSELQLRIGDEAAGALAEEFRIDAMFGRWGVLTRSGQTPR